MVRNIRRIQNSARQADLLRNMNENDDKFWKLCNKVAFQKADNAVDPWKEVELWMEKHMANQEIIRAAANYKSGDNNTPLHRIVQPTNYPPPLALVEKLVRLAPDSIQIRNKDGNLPLHIACKSSRKDLPSDVVRLLLQAYPGGAQVKATHYAQLPLHLACRGSVSHQLVSDLVQIYPRATYVKDKTGSLPLHLAMRVDASIETINLLIEANPTSLKVIPSQELRSYIARGNRQSFLWLHKAIYNGFSINLVNLLVKFLPKELLKRDTDGMLPLHHACQSKCPCYHDYVETLLNTNKKFLRRQISTKDNSQRLPLHRLAMNSNTVPKNLVRRIVDVYPESVSSRDKYGMIPFHYACLNPSTTVELLLYFLLHSPAEIIFG